MEFKQKNISQVAKNDKNMTLAYSNCLVVDSVMFHVSPLISWQVTNAIPLREGRPTLSCQETERRDECHAPDKRWKSSRRQPGRTSRGARTKGARFVSGWGKAISLYYASSAGLRVVLKRWWPVSMPDPPPPVSCGSALASGLGFEVFFCISPQDTLHSGL